MLDETAFRNLMSYDLLSSEEAVQAFRIPYADVSTRLFADFKLSEGTPTVQCYKEFTSDLQLAQVLIYDENLTDQLHQIGNRTIETLEKFSGLRVASIKLVFLQDINKKVWVMGSSDCKVYQTPSKENQTGVQPISINKIKNIPKKNKYSSVKLDLISRSQSSRRSSTTSRKKPCPGNFCAYKVINHNFTEDSKISLCLVPETESSASDLKSTARDQNHPRKDYEVPFKYIHMAKSLLKNFKHNLTFTVEELLNLDQNHSRPSGKPPNPLLHHSRAYDSIKVCERCYEFYNMLILIRTGGNQAKHSKSNKSSTPLRSINNYSQTSENVSQDSSAKRQLEILKKATTGNSQSRKNSKERSFTKLKSRSSSQEERNLETWKVYVKSLKNRPGLLM